MEEDDTIKTVDIMFESANSANGNSDYPRFENLKQLGLENVVGYQFLFANVPFVYNVIDATQNQFYFSDATNTDVLVSLPVGTYNSAQWPAIYQQALKTAGVTTYAKYSSYYDTVTNQLVFFGSADGSTPITFTIKTTPKNNIGLYDVFGLNPNITYTAAQLGANKLLYNGSLVGVPWSGTTNPFFFASTYTATLSGPNEMYLHSDLSAAFKSNGLVTDTISPINTPGTIGSGDVIAYWPINTVNSGVIRFTPNFVTPVKSGNGNNINNIQFYLTIGTQITYSSENQYGGNLSTSAGTSTSITPYLQLGGTSWQIGIRFFVQGDQLIHESGQATRATVPTNQQPPRFALKSTYDKSFPNKKLKF
jgi:hypothetical protein